MTSSCMGTSSRIARKVINDSERNHTPEQVGYVAFESALVYP